MFGYIVANQNELRLREFNLYRSYYCGLCRDLKENYGRAGQMTLSFDTTFLALLLTSLYEPEDTVSERRCLIHPFQKHPTRQNAFTRYAADVNVILSYYSCMDDWQDEKKYRKRAMAALLSGSSRRAGAMHPEKAKKICECLEELHRMEAAGEKDLDKVSGCFGSLMEEIFVYKEDVWAEALRRMGFYLGKFLYLLDAYDDLDKDAAAGSYNPLLPLREREDFESFCQGILTMMIAESCKAFELLPIVENVDILRNILYCGIWSKYNAKAEKIAQSAPT